MQQIEHNLEIITENAEYVFFLGGLLVKTKHKDLLN